MKAGSDASPTGRGRHFKPSAKLRKALLTLAKLVLTTIATWLILRGAGFTLAESWAVDWAALRPGIPYLALSLAVLCVSFAFGGWLWSRMLSEFGDSALPVAQSAAVRLVADLGRYIPGKIAQVAGLALLSRRAGLSPVRATAAAATTQILSLLAACLVGAPAALGIVAGQGDARIYWASLVVFAGLLSFLWFGGAGGLVRWILRRTGNPEDLPRGGGRRLLLWIPAYVVAWAIYGVALAILARGLGMTVPFFAVTSAFAAAYFLGYVALFAPAGVGIREASMVALLTPALGAEAAWTLAIMQRAWLTLADLAGALAGAAFLRHRKII